MESLIEIVEPDTEAIFQFVIKGDLESIAKCSPSELKKCTDKNGSTLLHYAAGNGNLEICKYLLQECEFKVEESSQKTGRAALHWAARNGHASICQTLVDEFGARVDSLARGQVTPLQLAIWQCHLSTAKCLVEKLGANPHFPNSWGCGIGHWLGKSPIYDGSQGSKIQLREACDWLFGHCGVEYNLPNNYGQCPLHKAAYAGNLIVAQYLVETYGIVDSVRDFNGNSAADCAERSQQHEVACWLRRFASPPFHNAIACLGFAAGERPSIWEIRRSYLDLAKKHHPDKVSSSCDGSHNESAIARWNEIQQSFRLLASWWQDPPDVFDLHIRMACRNAKLLEYEKLCWIPSWHKEQKRQEERLNSSHNNNNPSENPTSQGIRKELACSDTETKRVWLSQVELFTGDEMPSHSSRKGGWVTGTSCARCKDDWSSK
ncbi:unnamed protein product [Cylindrotheca closterium]|uniref:J domain-containing protein n=1 Tax=Cylindrotheca closterium TaxID=2856 RepID=A0AAD2G0X1_9STRA|nr:unnamed protein product [Cylindrotheca closterium]